MSDEREKYEFHFTSLEDQLSPQGDRVATCQFRGIVEDRHWPAIRDHLRKGIDVYVVPTLLHETVATLQADLERERQRYRDLEQEYAAFKTESHARFTDLGAAMSGMKNELQRLRVLEQQLNALSGLGVGQVVR